LSFGIDQSEFVVMQCYKNKSSHFLTKFEHSLGGSVPHLFFCSRMHL